MTRNISISSIDKRNLKQILYEKSVFGAAPTHYTLNGDDDWHPIQFVDNKRLEQIQFSDGTTIYVQGETNQTLATLNEIFRERNDANTLDGLEADIESALTEDLTTTYADERSHFRGVGGAAASKIASQYDFDEVEKRVLASEFTESELERWSEYPPAYIMQLKEKRIDDLTHEEFRILYGLASTAVDDPDPVPSAESAETVLTATDDPISEFLKKQHINPNPFGDKE